MRFSLVSLLPSLLLLLVAILLVALPRAAVDASPVRTDDYDLDVELLWSASAGDLEQCRLLLAQGADVNAVGMKNHDTPLHVSAAGGYLEVVQLFVWSGAEVNARDVEGWTPVDYARNKGHTAVVEFLQKYGGRSGADASSDGLDTQLRMMHLTHGQADVQDHMDTRE